MASRALVIGVSRHANGVVPTRNDRERAGDAQGRDRFHTAPFKRASAAPRIQLETSMPSRSAARTMRV